MLDEVASETRDRVQLKSERLRSALVEAIRRLPPGAILPTERELCATHQVSRATVRAVLHDLESERRIYRRQGKGTFVAPAKLEQRLGLTSHTEEMRANGIQPGSKLITVTRVAADAEVAAALRLLEGAEVLRIDRLRLADEEPIAIEVLYLDARRFDGITAALGENVSFYQLLHSEYGVELAEAEETIEAVIASEREAELLECGPTSALLQLSRRSLDTGGRPIEFVRSLYRGDRFRFRQHLERARAGAPLGPASVMGAPRLRAASAGDAAGLAAVFLAAWRREYPGIVHEGVLNGLDDAATEAWFGTLLATPGLTTLVAESERGPIGFARVGPDPDEPGVGHVFGFYVHPDASRRGVGRLLLERALTELEAAGSGEVTLWVFAANRCARRFYAAAGFAADGRTRVEEEYGAEEVHLRRPASAGAGSGHRLDAGRDRGARARARSASGASTRSEPELAVEIAARAPEGLLRVRGAIVDRLAGALERGYPPGVTLAVVDAAGELLRIHGGLACAVDEQVPTTAATVYDLASLTKVVVTVPLVLWLAEQGRWQLDDPAASWLPGFPRKELTLRQLLTHTSGLVPHREFYRQGRGLSVIRPAVYLEAVEAVPGRVDYSDLNYMLLGWAVARCAGRPLDRLFAEVVASPLGLTRTRFRPPARDRRQIAATELDGDQRLTAGLVWGEVHDGNCWALGGVSGHAGLFAPVTDQGRFAAALLDPEHHPVLSAASIAEMTHFQAGEPPDVRALGWRLDASEWGAWPESTYWHTGFTGTSLLVAPSAGVAVSLLMGGVHPIRRPDDQSRLRADVHRLLAEALV